MNLHVQDQDSIFDYRLVGISLCFEKSLINFKVYILIISFNTLNNILRHCITFIRFHDLTSNEFHKKVLPYKNFTKVRQKLYKEL